jgi:hypothetical protein
MYYDLGEGKFQLCPMWRYKTVSQWSRGMLKFYNLIKAGLVQITYSEYLELESTTTDALLTIASEYNQLANKKLETD